MKKAFTMIELVFIIVILGILASVAIPRLSSTRLDAELVKYQTDIKTFVNDLSSYYISRGEFASYPSTARNGLGMIFEDMSNVNISNQYGDSGYFAIRNVNCINFTVNNAKHTDTQKHSAYIAFSENRSGTNGVYIHKMKICQEVYKMPYIKKLLDHSRNIIIYKRADKNSKWEQVAGNSGVALGGQSIKW